MRPGSSGPAPSPRIVVLSGRVGAGKSTPRPRPWLRATVRAYIRTQDLMRDHAEAISESLPAERKALQEYGERLDREDRRAVGSRTGSPRSSVTTVIMDCSSWMPFVSSRRSSTLRAAFPVEGHSHSR